MVVSCQDVDSDVTNDGCVVVIGRLLGNTYDMLATIVVCVYIICRLVCNLDQSWKQYFSIKYVHAINTLHTTANICAHPYTMLDIINNE